MDAIELLKHDHRMVEQLFRDYQAAASEQQKRGVVDILIRELSKHAALEELMFYPFTKHVLSSAEQEIRERLDNHMAVKKLLVELDGVSVEDARADQLMTELERAVDGHVRMDEDDLMPRLQGEADEQALQELGDAIDKAKQLAPTRPHPAAPEEPPALALAAPLATIYDRLRDRLQGRPQT
jgi:hemerythrin superfamily protein